MSEPMQNAKNHTYNPSLKKKTTHIMYSLYFNATPVSVINTIKIENYRTVKNVDLLNITTQLLT